MRIGSSLTSLPNVNTSDDPVVYGNSKGIYVITPASDPVQQVIVYDFPGKKLYETTVNASFYPLSGNSGQSPLIVKVITKNRVKTVKINYY